ncbi:MAG: type II secretion system protein N, partial [Methylophilaceae bacterium]
IVLAPASVLSSWIYQRSEQHVLLAQAEGTIWNGSATVVLQGTSPEDMISAGKLRWEIFPLQLVLGRIYAALYWNDAPPAWLSIESSRVHLEHALFDMPASVVTQFLPAMRAAGLTGQLNIRTESVSLSEQSIQGDVFVDWMQASSPLSAISPLGNYHAQLSGNQDGLSIMLNTLNGALILNGSGNWSNQQGLDFQGSAQAEASKQKELSELLRVIGNEQVPGSGIFQISLKEH